MHVVSISRPYLLRSFLLAALLLWPLLLFGRPAYMPDSAGYQSGGEQAIAFVAHKLHLAPAAKGPAAPIPDGTDTGEASGKNAKVARAIVYSVVAYLLGGPDLSMIHLAIFHAISVGLVVTALFEAMAGPTRRGFMTMALILGLGTGLAPVVNFMIPDAFTGIMVGAMMVLPYYWRRFSWPTLLLVLGLASAAVAFHASHPPVALGTAIVVTLWFLLLRKHRPDSAMPALAMLWIPVLVGVSATMLTGLIGFGHASIAPKHYPLALARGLDNGPARWYLDDVCRDRTRYAMCEIYGTHMPKTVSEFLWEPDNIVTRATPAQFDRIRAEEKTILIRAALRYPAEQAYLIFHDVPEQFVSFRIDFFRYGGTIERESSGNIVLKNAGSGKTPALLGWLDRIANIVILIAVIALARWWRTMTVAQRGALLTLLAALLVNAAVCALFSGVAARYQLRLIWLVPFAALAVGFARKRHATSGLNHP